MKIGIAQLHMSLTLHDYTDVICHSIATFKAQDVDMVIFPEGATTGFNTGLLHTSDDELRRRIQAIGHCCNATETACFLPTRIPRAAHQAQGHVGALFISPGAPLQEFHKIGLTKSEAQHVLPGTHSQRLFTYRDHLFGVLFCREMYDPCDQYFSRDSHPEVILWPSFYAWHNDLNWKHPDYRPEHDYAARLLEHNTHWRSTIIQANWAWDLPASLSHMTSGSVIVLPNNTVDTRFVGSAPANMLVTLQPSGLPAIDAIGK